MWFFYAALIVAWLCAGWVAFVAVRAFRRDLKNERTHSEYPRHASDAQEITMTAGGEQATDVDTPEVAQLHTFSVAPTLDPETVRKRNVETQEHLRVLKHGFDPVTPRTVIPKVNIA